MVEKPLMEPWQAILLALLLAGAIAFFVLFRRKKAMEELETMPVAMLQPGKRVADIDAIINEESEMARAEEEAEEEARKRAAAPPPLPTPCCANALVGWLKRTQCVPCTSFGVG